MEHRIKEEIQYGEAGERSDVAQIQMPAPTLWPLALALGVMLLFAGIAINHVPGFVAAQLVGAAIATVVAMALLRNG